MNLFTKGLKSEYGNVMIVGWNDGVLGHFCAHCLG